MKKLIALLLACVMLVGMLAACSATNEGTTDADSIADEMTSEDGKYQVAFITDVGQLKDKGFTTTDGTILVRHYFRCSTHHIAHLLQPQLMH